MGLPKSGIREFFDIVSTRQGVISLAIGEPDFDTPWHIREAAITSLEQGKSHYTGNAGLMELRRAIADYVRDRFGGDYDPAHEVLVTVGASEGLDITLRALLNPGDEVLYHEPCFVSYGPEIAMAHGVPVPVETHVEDNFRLSVEALEAKVTPRTRVLVVNFPNNPTGAVLEREDVQAIADFVVRHDLILVSDEIYAELTWGGKRHVSFASVPGLKERLVLLHGYSKAWAMTGFRMAYVCAPAWMMDTILKIHQYQIMCAPTASQWASLEAMRQPAEDMAPMLRAYEMRRNFLRASFAEARVRRASARRRERRGRAGHGLRRVRRGLRALLLRHGHRPTERGRRPYRPFRQDPVRTSCAPTRRPPSPKSPSSRATRRALACKISWRAA